MEDEQMKILGYTPEQFAWIGVRITLGWTFLWAFLDKMFGLYPTASDHSWLAGGSPTAGYLGYATTGPLSGFYQGLTGSADAVAIVNVLFMLALLAIGVALILGVGMRIAGYSGAVLMVLLWSTNLPPANNPIIDEHIVFMILLLGLTVVKAGQWLGLGKWWVNTPMVKRIPLLE
jgi:thiosulfate dehydrogenase [quinone] large subunit